MLPLRRHRLDLDVVNSPAPPFQQAQITPNATRVRSFAITSVQMA
jgi:hypothetical protein